MSATKPFLSHTTNRWMLCLSVLVAALIAASCSWFSSNKPRPPVEIKGPLVAMMIASSIDEKGQLVNPRFTFPPDEKQVTVVIQVGKTTPSTLTVTWYQKSDDAADKKLFEHQIQVKDRDLAFSTGKNTGPLLLVGSYKVVATIGGETKEIEFDVAPPKSSSDKTSIGWDDDRSEKLVQLKGNRHGLSARTDSVDMPEYDLVTNQGLMRKVALNDSPQGPSQSADATAAQGQPPAAGSSGVASSSRGSLAVGSSWLFVGTEADSATNTDTQADSVEIFSGGWWADKDAGAQFQVSVYEATSGRQLGTYFLMGSMKEGGGTFDLDPCWSNGSDLPDTKVPVKAVIKKGSANGQELGTVSNVITLGRDTLAPRVHVVSTPARGSKVKSGDKINLKVDATELKTGGPWQTGVHMIQVTALPGGQVGEPWVNSASPLSQKCSQKTWEQKYEATYIVPQNPPPIIKICVLAEDYVGNESSNCGDFPTGHWYGSLDWSVHQTVPSGTQDWQGHADLALDEDGKGGLTGTLAGSETQTLGISACHGVTTWTVNASLAGTLSAQQMILNATERHSTRPEEASCGRARTGGDILMWPQLDELLRGLTAVGDGSYRSERDFGIPLGNAKFTLTVRPAR